MSIWRVSVIKIIAKPNRITILMEGFLEHLATVSQGMLKDSMQIYECAAPEKIEK